MNYHGFLQDSKGDFSSARLTFVVGMIVAIVVTFTTKDIAMAGMWAGLATTGKLASKFLER